MKTKRSIFKSIGGKILIIFVSISILTVAFLAIISGYMARKALRKCAFNQLDAVQSIKHSQIKEYFKYMESELHVLKDDPFAQNALYEFEKAFEAGGDTVDSEEWKALAEQYDYRMSDIKKDNEWYDIFLIHTDGDIVYTVTRESDLGMIIPDSSLKDSPLGEAFDKISKA
jgi:methyl-accepting chemotaxis protein